jgi:flagellar assembly factor FliW
MSEGEKIKFHNAKFGEVTIDRQDVLSFPQGLPGFERYKHYGLVEIEEEVPFLRLLSTEEPRLGFVLINPVLVWPDYEPGISPEDLEGLGITRAEQLAIYCIVTLSSKPEEVTANLKGPICINTETMQARQMILVDDRYTTKHAILAVQQQEK